MSLFDLKALQATLDQLEEEKKIPREKIIDAIEQALAAAYKKDYGKKGQIVRATFNSETGDVDFNQVKIAVDDTIVKPELTEEELAKVKTAKELTNETEGIVADSSEDDADERIHFNSEHHIYLDDARKIKNDAVLEEELIFPLESHEDFGRIAAQTAKQVIIQRIREAEKQSVIEEFADRQGEIISGIVQKVDRGMAFIDIAGVNGIMPREEQIPGEFYRTGQRIKAYLYMVEETPRGVALRLSRSHPRFIEALFAMESPEIASGTVEIKAIAREAGSRSKIAVWSNDENIDPIGACVGQKGIRVATVMSELAGEKIDIIPWSNDPAELVAASLAPAKVIDIEVNENDRYAKIEVASDQLSLAIGKGGQNVRLAAKLTGWKIDIAGVETPESIAQAAQVAADKEAREAAAANEVAESVDEVEEEEVVAGDAE
jgi:N utilization substance protein A